MVVTVVTTANGVVQDTANHPYWPGAGAETTYTTTLTGETRFDCFTCASKAAEAVSRDAYTLTERTPGRRGKPGRWNAPARTA